MPRDFGSKFGRNLVTVAIRFAANPFGVFCEKQKKVSLLP